MNTLEPTDLDPARPNNGCVSTGAHQFDGCIAVGGGFPGIMARDAAAWAIVLRSAAGDIGALDDVDQPCADEASVGADGTFNALDQP